MFTISPTGMFKGIIADASHYFHGYRSYFKVMQLLLIFVGINFHLNLKAKSECCTL